MLKIFNITEKFSGAYDLLSSRINNYHDGGSASEGLCTDLEYTLGLDNQGEMGIKEGIIGVIAIGLLVFIIYKLIEVVLVMT